MRGRLPPGGPRRTAGRTLASAPPALGALLLGALGLAAACGQGEPEARGLSDSLYVAVMARLTAIDRDLARRAPERADSARRAVLARHDVSTEALRAYAARHGDDPAHLAEIWRAIQATADTLMGTVPADVGPDTGVEETEPPEEEIGRAEPPESGTARAAATPSVRRRG